ncbi:MAG: ECF family RNA polymerase sigma factor [Algoriphagus marincola HL-49]|uniref:ECF family RNA polymerase sigma factor n=1 Tax=Algoriphagus marincola HL-49 TaxID=1305737 RepID=A0A0P7YIS0_9BACT|nr:MAG: ECF family RNA polymerase sigma factor [Algoriphagus marincola HL-49]
MKLNKHASDREISEMIRMKKDQNIAIAQLYEQHYGLLEKLVLQNNGTEDDAADVIQDSMLVLVQMIKSEKFRGEASIKSILYSIAKNKWISEIRKQKSTQNRHESYHLEEDEYSPDVSEAIANQENLKYVMALFEKLGDTCRRILQLFYYEELAMKEICEQLEFSSEQVLRNKKYKCLKSLTDSVKASPGISKTLQKILRNEK